MVQRMMGLVLVQYGFEYTAKDGRLVTIKPNESYILVSKTNEHWWHVRKNQHTRPFYVPAQYVKEVTSLSGESGVEKDLQESVKNTKPAGNDQTTPVTATRKAPDQGASEMYLFSTFGFSEVTPDRPGEVPQDRQTATRLANSSDYLKTHNSTGSFSLPSAPLKTNDLQLEVKPCPTPEIRSDQSTKCAVDKKEEPQIFLHKEDLDFPLPPAVSAHEDTPEPNISESDSFSRQPTTDPFMLKQQDFNPTVERSPVTVSLNDQVEKESVQSAIYVNVAQLRQSISESPPSAASSCSPSYFDPERWEVHVDQESGQEYYYHPTTGRTTWDNPFLDSPTDPERFPAEELGSPSPLLSPALSPSTASPPTSWSSDWERLVDETSGRPYFYNPMSGETSWEPPELLSPYPSVMEPMSVHRFHQDRPPSLPEQDYPPEDYPVPDQPEVYEELLATGPPTLPKEYTLSHVSRTIIPRANLDRSTPPGWNLTVDPNGTWVFTSEHSPEQWVKSVDDRGQTYYYLRDGSKSLWSLPEAPVSPGGQSRLENGGVMENASVMKNWRHSVGPVHFGSGQDDGRFVPTHRRNTSDYSSDSSSTGNSPETQNAQNLEKAGILNKTKISENGKKVRKNWTQTWTVLLGGVLTFHKDPKSAAMGNLNKTNQIVPEFTVDLRGATVGWASKDKSSKKNVLELKGKNGVEFLIQYDTESIICDWHKVLTDTIRQLEFQDHHSEEEDGDLYEKIPNTDAPKEEKLGGGSEKARPSRPSVTHSSSSAGDSEQKRVRTKLMKFLMKRPTLQSVKEKGYIRDSVFGCHLAKLCAQEKNTVPSFVEKCVKAVEKRGLDIDGLYRVSGNLAIIQKLRFKADHEELDLEDGQWEDVHVITGALKLFFRELPEPLFPYSHFNKFITAIRMADYNVRLSCIYDLVKSLPPSNHDTMKLLFGHLRRVIQYGDDNRMTVGNVAIVFGPTLLRPEMESSNIAMHMVFQNQIVEFILNEYERIFSSS
ncbi:rho GTPase-activating protein 27 isoform X2 [Antennarius striatus]|uniref:rho GTPase-activating protein 27 isoform X2 n=1 Tax=Antennarius striatus TaxID=241820 RepID=UPI0035B43C7B